jgi:hypothetical protein
MGWMVGFRFPAGHGIFLYSSASRAALGSTQPPIQWVPGVISPRVGRTGREADHSPSAEIKNGGAISPLPHSPSWRGA